jgi:hypothetical protein
MSANSTSTLGAGGRAVAVSGGARMSNLYQSNDLSQNFSYDDIAIQLIGYMGHRVQPPEMA